VPFPKKLLNDGEDLYLDLRPHWWYFSKHILSAIPLFLLLLLLWKWHNGFTWVFVGLVWLAWGLWLAAKYVQWNYTHFVVTSNGYLRTGVRKHGVKIPMTPSATSTSTRGVERIHRCRDSIDCNATWPVRFDMSGPHRGARDPS
jgi:hypothetical protein